MNYLLIVYVIIIYLFINVYYYILWFIYSLLMIISYQLLIFQNYSSLRHWHTRLVSSWVSLTSWGEGASLALVGNPSIDGATIKMLYGVDVLDWPALHPIFS